MHWLKYARLNRKDRLKNMRGMTLEVAMLADVSWAYSAISNVKVMKHYFMFIYMLYSLKMVRTKDHRSL